MYLCGPLGIHARAMVRTDHGIACIEQRFHDGAEVGHALAAIAEPRTAIDVDDHGITLCLLLGQIDVAVVEGLAVAGIVHVLPLLRGL